MRIGVGRPSLKLTCILNIFCLFYVMRWAFAFCGSSKYTTHILSSCNMIIFQFLLRVLRPSVCSEVDLVRQSILVLLGFSLCLFVTECSVFNNCKHEFDYFHIREVSSSLNHELQLLYKRDAVREV